MAHFRKRDNGIYYAFWKEKRVDGEWHTMARSLKTSNKVIAKRRFDQSFGDGFDEIKEWIASLKSYTNRWREEMPTLEQAVQQAAGKASLNLMKHEFKAPCKITRGISMIVYGDPGVGKSTLASTLPVGTTLIISVESGIGPFMGTGHRLVNVKEAMVNSNMNIEEVMNDIYRKIRTKEIPIDNVVIDNMSELIKTVLHHFTESRKKEFPEIKEHGDTAYKIMEWINNWRDLVDLNINVIINAWESQLDIQNSDGTIITKTCPDLGKSSTLRACGLVDAVARLEVFEKTQKRWLRFGPTKQYQTKCQFKGLITIDNPTGAQEPDLTEVIRKLKEYDYQIPS